ncbi:HNH endonuclease signature motif containing protein [Dyadobacter sp. LHD-138]|uniref:HNH endonuclease signature motif containing protein n=1 Tax=Dyadobacter sp. LHD-138 TaxID=3071413 RepID=UPI0027E0D543|nr:HNH endonuclease signature motif containing protein [Dyadobacter sp. LHD-138]MDQ6481609.1 HNH endonuclease signature motif containing protein [Dyadobacter sp. LHD-138]
MENSIVLKQVRFLAVVIFAGVQNIGIREIVTKKTMNKLEVEKFKNSSLWRRTLRPEKLRQQPSCETCHIKGKLTEASAVEFIIKLEDGGDRFDYSNMISLCKRCQIIKTAEANRNR